ncbi:hypothetical protein AVEN_232293-1 [Araneus ventricosus]|uniref:Uncharacterized protein n=1 Tax=Araneus ventricosus TaxID=182803 RepID=A0A4Y2SH01_ARAVE|nr:hypothetical protein AVEN_79495-1 [Araneus ventricosus]GBN86580.1 hypothetical protein AVEN_232293-1 [Araneus ventricosus]
MLGRRISDRSVPPGTLHGLQQALLQGWALLPQQAINDAIASMPRRCQAYISARGYHTRYLACGSHCTFCLPICAFWFVFASLFDMWSSNATSTSCTTFTHIH